MAIILIVASVMLACTHSLTDNGVSEERNKQF